MDYAALYKNKLFVAAINLFFGNAVHPLLSGLQKTLCASLNKHFGLFALIIAVTFSHIFAHFVDKVLVVLLVVLY